MCRYKMLQDWYTGFQFIDFTFNIFCMFVFTFYLVCHPVSLNAWYCYVVNILYVALNILFQM